MSAFDSHFRRQQACETRPVRSARATRTLSAIVIAVAMLAAGLIAAPVASAAPADPTPDAAPAAAPTTYIVETKPGIRSTDLVGPSLASASVGYEYTSVLNGFSAELTPSQAALLATSPNVVSVTPDAVVSIADERVSPTWGLDRIDQRPTAGDGVYHYDTTGAGVTAFVIDTGIRFTHTEFGGRASSGYDFIDDDSDASDCHGHGTHVAGTIGGKTYGVASAVKLVGVRVLGCDGYGTVSGVAAGLDWVVSNKPAGPSVVNMSIGAVQSSLLDEAVQNTTAAGITVVVAAGNNNSDACLYSPAAAPSAITVAATTSVDARASYSNFGTCVDIFAPGSGVLSSYYLSDTATAYLTGTSMASPHVAGAVARLLQANPTATPATITSLLTADATPSVVTSPLGSPNLLLYAPYAPTTTVITPVTPLITGSAVVGSTLTAVPGAWSPAPITFVYKWFSGGVAVTGEVASTYLVRPVDAGKKITLTVTGSRAGFTSVSKSSAATVTVPIVTTPIPLTSTPSPSITGTPAVGSTLTAATGAWAPAPVTFAYKWFSGGVAVAGATTSTYVVTAGDVGKKITLTVTGSKTGYVSASKSSPATATVPAPPATKPLTSTPPPTIVGTPIVGQTLTARTGTWQPSPVTLTYQWNRNGSPITGATSLTYLITTTDLGAQLSVSVTGKKTGYTSATTTSAPLSKVTAKVVVGATPTITGTATVGQKQTAVPGAWTPTPVTFTYVWWRNNVAIAGAKSSTYTTTAADRGTILTVTVTGSKSGYTSTSKTSAGRPIG